MSVRRNIWGLRLLAVAIAVLVWFFVTLQKREEVSERSIDAAVTYSPPRGFIVLDPVQRVRVQLRGRTSKIRNLNPFIVDVLVDVSRSDHGTAEVHLSPENVIVPDGVEVLSIDPNALRVRLDREVQAMLPVLPRLVGEPAAGAVVGDVEVRPSRVLVSGPESRLREIGSLSTTAIDLDGHALDFEETAAVLAPDPLIKVVQPAVVTIRVPMQPPSPASRSREDGQ
jgi:YbbR domain-containing protein